MSFLEKRRDDYSYCYAHYNHDSDRFRALREKAGDRLIPVRADFSDEGDVRKIIETVEEKGIFPDHFIHTVSDKMTGGKFHKRDASDFDRALRISVLSAVTLLNRFLDSMTRKKYGRIVFLLTSCTFGIPPKYQSPYVTSKYALS